MTVKQIDLKDKCEHIAIHKVWFPEYYDKGWYRMMTSFAAFFESAKTRNRGERYLYYLIRDGEIGMDHQFEIERDAKLPVVSHAGLYEFFGSIGYCRKRKKLLVED